MVTALQLIKDQIVDARKTFEGTIADVTPAQLQHDPGGRALPIGSVIAHCAFSEDVIVQSMMQGKPALYMTEWKDRTGVSAPMPPMDEHWSEANERWAKAVQVDLPQLREYMQAVFVTTDTFVNGLDDAGLVKEIDLGSWGKKTVAEMLSGFVIAHTNSLAGEISALKGAQGAKGYPF